MPKNFILGKISVLCKYSKFSHAKIKLKHMTQTSDTSCLINGIKPSTLYLPKLPEFSQKTLFDYLIFKFPHILKTTWQQRFLTGKITDTHGLPLNLTTPYQHGHTIHYYRELPPDSEPIIPFCEQILHLDEHLIVVDKPHFLPVIPTGRYLNETLLTRLRLRPELAHLNVAHITPIHRLDKDTAGVMLFSHNLASRSQYSQLFATKQIQKTYHAIAPTLDLKSENFYPFEIRSRLVRGEDFFTTQTVIGAVNAITQINKLNDFEKEGKKLSLYQLNPITGKKHQLRVHMNSLGIPLVNDRLYPTIQPFSEIADFSQPLQLLAKRIEFSDPITGEWRVFESERELG